jgi:hypothetical protein
MGKVGNFFKAIPEVYYNIRRRNEKIDLLLQTHTDTLAELKNLQNCFSERTEELKKLQNDVKDIIGSLNTVKHGTKMELFETLHNWRQLLVVKRGWATIEEKREVEEIYIIYHDELHGNGNGERYYKEIIALPESEEEMEAKKNV